MVLLGLIIAKLKERKEQIVGMHAWIACIYAIWINGTVLIELLVLQLSLKNVHFLKMVPSFSLWKIGITLFLSSRQQVQ